MSFTSPCDTPCGTVVLSAGYAPHLFGSIALTTPPSVAALSGVVLAVQPIVTVKNQLGATDLTYIGPVTVAIATGPGTLNVTTTTAVAGIATFIGLAITGAGTSTLVFSVPGRGSATSGNIVIT